MKQPPQIAILGAGSVGCYLGGRLLSAGARVSFIGRERLQSVIREHGLTITDYHGYEHHSAPTNVDFQTAPETAADADLVLLTVKSAATEDAGKQIAPYLKPGTPVISLQNGISNADRLQVVLPEATVLAGMVPFNVLQKAPGHFHQGTEGHLVADRSERLQPEVLECFTQAGLPLELRDDMPSVLWSKVILNMNNPVNALSGLPLKEELSQRAYRQCLALAQRETLAQLKAANIPTIKLASVPMPWVPTVMSLPDWLFQRLASKLLAIDPYARSSMWEDLEAGRATEIDWINGEVVRLADRLGRPAPVNRKLIALIREAETGKTQRWGGENLLKELRNSL